MPNCNEMEKTLSDECIGAQQLATHQLQLLQRAAQLHAQGWEQFAIAAAVEKAAIVLATGDPRFAQANAFMPEI